MMVRSGSAAIRDGVTLIEVLLVLALLVALASVTWPSLEPTLAAYQLRKSVDQLRAEWNQARTTALSSGQTVQFRFTPNGHRFCLETLPEPSLAPGGQTGISVSQTVFASVHTASLPETITFVDGTVEEDGSMPASDVAPQAREGWSAPIQFYPDGTASTVYLTLRNERDQCIQITLRGLTGVVTVGDVHSSPE